MKIFVQNQTIEEVMTFLEEAVGWTTVINQETKWVEMMPNCSCKQFEDVTEFMTTSTIVLIHRMGGKIQFKTNLLEHEGVYKILDMFHQFFERTHLSKEETEESMRLIGSHLRKVENLDGQEVDLLTAFTNIDIMPMKEEDFPIQLVKEAAEQWKNKATAELAEEGLKQAEKALEKMQRDFLSIHQSLLFSKAAIRGSSIAIKHLLAGEESSRKEIAMKQLVDELLNLAMATQVAISKNSEYLPPISERERLIKILKVREEMVDVMKEKEEGMGLSTKKREIPIYPYSLLASNIPTGQKNMLSPTRKIALRFLEPIRTGNAWEFLPILKKILIMDQKLIRKYLLQEKIENSH
uniref:Uncharacterized protein n=1 Tax=Hubei noda-like virus 24 TaxID=1922980 RepID=A0A1L3KGH5_9VIRU|nr:hypothetical protein 2 [Hubei noda-like virus 24]